MPRQDWKLVISVLVQPQQGAAERGEIRSLILDENMHRERLVHVLRFKDLNSQL